MKLLVILFIIKIFAPINVFKLLIMRYRNFPFELLSYDQIIISILSLPNIFCTLICPTKNFVPLKFLWSINLVQNLNCKKCFFFFYHFQGIQFIAFSSNQFENLENSKTCQIFAKYFQSEFCCKKVSKKKILTGTV